MKALKIEPGFSIDVSFCDEEIKIQPLYRCFYCRKPLPDELGERRSCLTCPPAPPEIMIY